MDSKVDRYNFNLFENGTSFTEKVEVDVDNQTEVFRVPRHNDNDAVDLMNDFAAGLTARRVPLSKDCYVSKLDPSVPSPREMKMEMDKASEQPLPNKVKVRRTEVKLLGFADRKALPQKILDFCGSFPIYNIKEVQMDERHSFITRENGKGRRKRSHWISQWNGCSHGDQKQMQHCLNKVGHLNLTLSCKYDVILCFYRATCKHIATVNTLQPTYQCTGIRHDVNVIGLCCSAIC